LFCNLFIRSTRRTLYEKRRDDVCVLMFGGNNLVKCS
jgi:1-aminocyclopropane-1-carboxylate deaminase/D-cysteine desulfhydrase-like pyridoxal-dependent ACC family enzyme